VPAAQEVAVQLPAQVTLLLSQRLLPHALVVEVVQVPEPLQTEGVVTFPAVQLAGVQTVESSG
jgi:uncharacterized lipoprotein YmbA